MIKAIVFLLAAIGYVIVFDIAHPVLRSWLGDTKPASLAIQLLFIGPFLALLRPVARAFQKRLPADERGKNRNELLWSGHFSLKRAFWGGFIPFATLSAVLGNYSASRTNGPEPGDMYWAVLGMVVMLIVVGLAALGVWRSGQRYEGAYKWVRLSRITMSAVVLAIVLSLLYTAQT